MSSLRARAFRDLLTFTRASTGTYSDAAGVLRSAAVDVPRIEYDPGTLAVRGLLLEESRTNYLLYSQEFDNAAWSKVRSSILANWIVAPDGTKTADALVEDTTANDTHYALQSYTKSSSTELQAYCASIWVKTAGRTELRLRCQGTSGAGNSASATFDLSAGTAGSATVAGAWDNGGARIEAWPGNWYRCMLDFRINNDGQATVQFIAFLSVSGAISYTGNGASGLYLWGAQLEKGTYPTSYITTTSAAVARSADVCRVTDLEPWFNEDVGTIFAEYLIPWTYLASDTTGSRRLVQIDDGDDSDRHLIYLNAGNRRIAVTKASAQQADLSTGAYTPGVVSRQALAWAENDIAAAATGSGVSTDTSADMPLNLTHFRIGHSSSGVVQPNAYIRKVRFYPRRVSDADLLTLVA